MKTIQYSVLYQMTMWKQQNNVAGVPRTDEPAENSLESAASYDFMELNSEFLPLFYCFGSFSQLLWGHFLQQQAAAFSEKAIKTHCTLYAQHQTETCW